LEYREAESDSYESGSKKHDMLIVSGGQIEDALILGLLEKHHYETVVACDSGIEFFRRNGRCPDVVFGDFDSANAQTVAYFKAQPQVRMERFPAEKDWTDTELAVRRALALRPDRIDLVGATGSRLDHVLGNLQLLLLGLEAGVPIFLIDAHNRIRLIDRALTIARDEQYGDFVSLLPCAGSVTGVTLRGMKYPLKRATLTPDITLGISNEIVADTAQITFETGKLFVIESRD